MLNQYDTRWKNEKLGSSSSTIGGYGCNLTCICEGLNRHGYSYTPKTLNDLFKSNGSYTSGNLISPATVAAKNQSIFTSGSSEAWNDDKVRAYLKASDTIVIGEVDGRGIGGSGQHFVLLLKLVEKNGKITNTKIGDPWGGLENLVTVRYAKYGCIKSLRIYHLKKGDNNNTKTSNNSANDSNNSNTSQSSNQGESMLIEFLGVESEQAGKKKLIEHLGKEGNKCGWGDASGDNTGGHLGSERRKVKKLEAEVADLQTEVKTAQNTAKNAQNELQKANQDYSKQLGEKDKIIKAQEKQINILDQTLIDKNKEIDTLAKDKKQLQQEVLTAKSQFDADYISSLERERGELKTESAKLKKENQTLKAQLDGRTAACTQEYVTSLEQKVQAQEKEITSLQDQLIAKERETKKGIVARLLQLIGL